MTHYTDDQLKTMWSHFTRGHEREIGFLPNTVYAPAYRDGRLLTIVDQGEPLAMLLTSKPGPRFRIFQTLTAVDARLCDLARRNVLEAIAAAASNHCERVTLRCAIDLPSNNFWAAMGFTLLGQERSTALVPRECNRWQWRFPLGEQLDAYLADQLADEKTRRLCQLLGFTDRLLAHREKTWRRQIFKVS